MLRSFAPAQFSEAVSGGEAGDAAADDDYVAS